MFIQDTLRQFVSHTHHSRRTWLATHSPATRMQSESRHRPTPRSRTRNVCARRRRPLPFASPARKRPGVRHRRPHAARPRCFPCARITAFRFEPLCSQAAQHLESGLRQHPCDLDAISIISSSRAHGQASRRPRGAPRVTLRQPSRRPSPRRAQAAAPARLTCAASRRRWRRCPAPSCP